MYFGTILFLVAVAGGVAAQPPTEQHRLGVRVDGSKSADLVPDDLAYRHFILSIAERRDVGPAQLRGRETRLDAVGLAPGDRALLLIAVDGLREELEAVETARRAALASVTSTRNAELISIRAREERAFADAMGRLRWLSPEGRARLDQHIRTYVKKRIVILGETGGNGGACCPAASSKEQLPRRGNR